MSTSKNFADYIIDQLSDIDGISIKKMFGEYGLFLSGKMVGLLCDDNLFIKPTEAGKKLIEDITYFSPYKGAKPYFLIDNIDNRFFLKELIIKTEQALPLPKKKKDRL